MHCFVSRALLSLVIQFIRRIAGDQVCLYFIQRFSVQYSPKIKYYYDHNSFSPADGLLMFVLYITVENFAGISHILLEYQLSRDFENHDALENPSRKGTLLK